jgi:hypothetical protein
MSLRILFGPQRFDRIDQAGSPGGQITGDERNCREHQKSAEESGRIERSDSVKQTIQGAAGGEGSQ